MSTKRNYKSINNILKWDNSFSFKIEAILIENITLHQHCMHIDLCKCVNVLIYV